MLVDALNKVINMNRGLYQLTKQRNIKSRLYSSDGFERLYQIMGDIIVTRWLSTIYKVEYNYEQRLLIKNNQKTKDTKHSI